MFSAYASDRERDGPAAAILRTLREVGCNTANEREFEMGLMAYTIAMTAWHQSRGNMVGARATKTRVGRNDRCPCGSGKKYKKCCLDNDRMPSSSDPLAAAGFRPELVPHVWDADAVAEDCSVLELIMDRDRAFADVGFSAERVVAFVDAVARKEPLPDEDGEALSSTIDDLAIRYARESGEAVAIKDMEPRLHAAMARAHTDAERRALATGLFMTTMAEATDDPHDNLFNVLLFRKALFGRLRISAVIDNLIESMGFSADELRRLADANDPVLWDTLKSRAKDLGEDDVRQLEKIVERNHQELWEVISSGEFPVPLPLATQTAIFQQLAAIDVDDDQDGAEALYEIIEKFANELIEEDYIVYSRMLNQWLQECEEPTGRIARAVQTMASLCAIRSLESYVPNLVVRCRERFFAFDEEEQPLIESCKESRGSAAWVAEYAGWLRSKNYPGLADRLLKFQDSMRERRVA